MHDQEMLKVLRQETFKLAISGEPIEDNIAATLLAMGRDIRQQEICRDISNKNLRLREMQRQIKEQYDFDASGFSDDDILNVYELLDNEYMRGGWTSEMPMPYHLFAKWSCPFPQDYIIHEIDSLEFPEEEPALNRKKAG